MIKKKQLLHIFWYKIIICKFPRTHVSLRDLSLPCCSRKSLRSKGFSFSYTYSKSNTKEGDAKRNSKAKTISFGYSLLTREVYDILTLWNLI